MSQLGWIPVSEPCAEADGALMPGLITKHGAIAWVRGGEVFMEVWPSESPEHIDDAFTLTLTVDRDVHEERSAVRRCSTTPRKARGGTSIVVAGGFPAPAEIATSLLAVVGALGR